ncbi:MAG TPA: uroporphyrinogen decarboxylase family protein [Phycisphaerae bacterium]|nr:uroporphyrinogen decarboxylase family protein [Phycisphaerae bacterium]
MSYERGMAAIRLEAPDEIPHTQYVTHPEWVGQLRKRAGKPDADVAELLDFDFRWSTAGPNIGRGRWTDMGHAVWMPDGSDCRPSVESPFKDVEEIYRLDPVQEYGPVDFQAQVEKYQAWYDEARRGTGVISGGTYKSVISYAIDAFGWENLLMAAGVDAERFGRALNRWADYLLENYVKAWAATDIEVFLTHDDMVWTSGGFLQPDFYRTYVFPNYQRHWDIVKDAGKKVLFCSDGNFTDYVDDIAAAGADGFIFEPTTDLEYVCSRYGQTHVIIGNADCRILTFGTKEEVRAEVKRCMDLGRDCPGYFFAVGNHIPPNVPVENADACMEAYRAMRRR